MLVKINGEQWSIVDGKLNLNYDAEWQAKWERDQQVLIAQADARFEALLVE